MDATVTELADVLYVDPGDVRSVLSMFGEPLDDVIPEETCSEVLDHLDPWPTPRRVPEYVEDEPDPPVNPLSLPRD